jgi:hypothetical protein
MAKELTANTKSELAENFRTILKRIFACNNFEQAFTVISCNITLIQEKYNSKAYTIQEKPFEICFKLEHPHSTSQYNIEYLQDFLAIITDANLYIENQEFFDAYITLFIDVTRDYLQYLKSKSHDDLQTYLKCLKDERQQRHQQCKAIREISEQKSVDAIAELQKQAKDCKLPPNVQSYFEKGGIVLELANSFKRYAISATTKLPEAIICIAIDSLLFPLHIIKTKIDNIVEENIRNGCTDVAYIYYRVEQKVKLDINNFQSQYFELVKSLFDVELDEEIKVDGIQDLMLELDSLKQLFNGSDFTLEEFYGLSEYIRFYIVNCPSKIIYIIHDPKVTRADFIDFVLPCFASRYLLKILKSQEKLQDDMLSDFNQQPIRMVSLFYEYKLIDDRSSIKAEFKTIQCCLEAIYTFLRSPFFDLAAFIQMQPELKLLLLLDKQAMLNCSTLFQYGVTFEALNRFDVEFARALLGAVNDVILLRDDNDLQATEFSNFLLTASRETIELFLKEHLSISNFCYLSRVSINRLLGLEHEKILLIVNNSKLIASLLLYYFIEEDNLFSMSVQEMSVQIENPSKHLTYHNNSVDYTKVRSVVATTAHQGLVAAERFVNSGWSVNLGAMCENIKILPQQLLKCNLNFHQVRAIYAEFISIYVEFVTTHMQIYFPSTAVIFVDFDYNNTKSFVFPSDIAKKLDSDFAAYRKYLFGKLSKVHSEPGEFAGVVADINSSLSMTDLLEKINNKLKNVLEEIEQNGFHVRYITLFNVIFTSNITEHLNSEDNSLQQRMKAWHKLLETNFRPDELRLALDPGGIAEAECALFLSFYAYMYQLKMLALHYKRVPEFCLAFNDVKLENQMFGAIFMRDVAGIRTLIQKGSVVLGHSYKGISYIVAAILTDAPDVISIIKNAIIDSKRNLWASYLQTNKFASISARNPNKQTVLEHILASQNSELLQIFIAHCISIEGEQKRIVLNSRWFPMMLNFNNPSFYIMSDVVVLQRHFYSRPTACEVKCGIPVCSIS